jgi:hypothetical protein
MTAINPAFHNGVWAWLIGDFALEFPRREGRFVLASVTRAAGGRYVMTPGTRCWRIPVYVPRWVRQAGKFGYMYPLAGWSRLRGLHVIY